MKNSVVDLISKEIKVQEEEDLREEQRKQSIERQVEEQAVNLCDKLEEFLESHKPSNIVQIYGDEDIYSISYILNEGGDEFVHLIENAMNGGDLYNTFESHALTDRFEIELESRGYKDFKFNQYTSEFKFVFKKK